MDSSKAKVFPRRTSFLQPGVNPFVYHLQLTPLQKLQVAVMSLTIAPIRFILLTVLFFVTWFWGVIVTAGMPVHPKEPLGRTRTTLCNTFRILARSMLFIIGFHSIRVRGERASTTEAPILVVAPHSSMFDVFISFVSSPLPSGVSRYENYETPFIGTLSKLVQPVFVSRKDPDSRRNTVNELIKRAKLPGRWPQILIFPEGTCTNGKTLITFKPGAFIPGAPVQPVLIEYLNKLDTVTWSMISPSAIMLFWLSLCQFSIKTRVTYLPVYKPVQSEIEDSKLYAYNVRTVMAESLQIPCTDHTFEDCRLMRHAESLRLPMESGLLEFAKLSQKLGINIDNAQEKLSEFSRIAADRPDGQISLGDFSKYLNVPASPALEEMFSLYDRDQSGFIDFREYVIGLSLVSQPAVTETSVKLAFDIFDRDGTGTITREDFNRVMSATFGQEFDGSDLFKDIKKSCTDRITFEEFHAFLESRPEYAKLFLWFTEVDQDAFESDFPRLNALFGKREHNSVAHRKKSVSSK